MDKIPDVILVGLAVGVFVGGTVWALAWWLSGQFSEVRNLVYQQMSHVQHSILSKLEYHEKHDDQRFGQLREDLGEIRIRNAAKDTIMTTILEKIHKLD